MVVIGGLVLPERGLLFSMPISAEHHALAASEQGCAPT
jgi:hypothetical protein